jgi:hypothetical protein
VDSLTVHHLARELDARWRGGTIRAGHLDRDRRRVVIATAHDASGVEIDLAHPDVIARASPIAASGGALAGWLVESVTAPEDDRRLIIALAREGKFRGSAHKRAQLEISLLPTARAALAHESGRAIGRVGGALPPRAAPRPVLDDITVRTAAADGDAPALMRGRWVSPLIARWLIAAPMSAPARYRELCALGDARPSICGDAIVPFPFCANAVTTDSLLAPASVTGDAAAVPPDARRARALQRMQRELERAASAPHLRLVADALLALGEVDAPAMVRLPDGSDAAVEHARGESAVAAAERLYATVRSMERARASLPARIDAFARAPATAALPRSGATRGPRVAAHSSAHPFRTYRSSGGLAIWVGRGAASNDALTFHESSPRDIWLHARDSAGAHVVLRWAHDESPPPRDLEEAAILAAWHSKSRGAGLVPVDWTRRKYVRKPKGSAPGLVVLQRSETIFVSPDERVERRLREG